MAHKDPRSQTALVLIVDDDEAVVEITAELLETLGYDVLRLEMARSYRIIVQELSYIRFRCPASEASSLPK
jgi:CheY-like chemotaxis protein